MRVLITGGLGYIGARLAQSLSDSGYKIIIGTRQKLSSLDWLPNSEIRCVEWESDLSIARLCDGVDVIVHAAAMNAIDCSQEPVSALKFNGLTTGRLVRAANHAGVKRFVYLSTAHVYENPLVGKISESTCVRNPHPYATSHHAGEKVVQQISQEGSIAGVILRLSNSYGAPISEDVNCWSLVVNDLCRQAAQNGLMVLNTNGQQYRDFIPMTQVCNAIGIVLSHEQLKAGSRLLNLGIGKSVTVKSMAYFIQLRCREILGFQPELEFKSTVSEGFHKPFKFEIDGIKKYGFLPSNDHAAEIDNLLRFCQHHFSSIKK